MSNQTRGARFERKVRGVLEADGWFVTKAGGSRGTADLVAGRRGVWLLVQCKIPTGPLPPRERESLLRAAEVTGGIPLHVHPAGRELLWRRLTGQAHDAWEKWEGTK